MKQQLGILMNLIKCEIMEKPCDLSGFLALDPSEQQTLAAVSIRHSVGQLLEDAIQKNPAARKLPVAGILGNQIMLALSQVAHLEMEREAVCREFDMAGIPYVLLKGARVRDLYPKAWMRISCDNDILVPRPQAEEAAELLIRRLGYRKDSDDYHDISLYSKSNVHLELHFTLCNDLEPMDRVLEQVWSCCTPQPGSWEYVQSNEFFLLHHIAHMAYHVIHGGCGIRPFADLQLIRTKMTFDREQLQNLLRQAGLERFYENACHLTDVWFSDAAHTPQSQRLEAYILSGGVYGTRKNRVAVSVAGKEKGSKAAYFLSRIWLPYSQLRLRYPEAAACRWKIPICQLRRWMQLLHKKSTVRAELEAISGMDESKSEWISQLLEDNGLI